MQTIGSHSKKRTNSLIRMAGQVKDKGPVLQYYKYITKSLLQASQQPLCTLPGFALFKLSTFHQIARAVVRAVGSGHIHVQLHENCAFNFSVREKHTPRVQATNRRRTVPSCPVAFVAAVFRGTAVSCMQLSRTRPMRQY